MVNVELNKKSNNPFKGLSNCLKVLQNIEIVHDSNTFNLCWNEVKNNKEHRELFFSLMFSMGDITSRQHNIFKGIKKDSINLSSGYLHTTEANLRSS